MKLLFIGEQSIYDAIRERLEALCDCISTELQCAPHLGLQLYTFDTIIFESKLFRDFLELIESSDVTFNQSTQIYVIGPYIDDYTIQAFTSHKQFQYIPLSQIDQQLLPNLQSLCKQKCHHD